MDAPQIILTFTPLKSSFSTTRIVTLKENHSVDIGRLVEGTEQSSNLKFVSKVVSRAHAKIAFTSGKVYIQDVKSSSGTFVNSSRLSAPGQASDFSELRDGDILQLGEDYSANGVFISCVVMSVAIQRKEVEAAPEQDLNYEDVSQDPQLRANVINEFNSVWTHLTRNIRSPMDRLAELKARLNTSA